MLYALEGGVRHRCCLGFEISGDAPERLQARRQAGHQCFIKEAKNQMGPAMKRPAMAK